jgi:hypothetical protein
MVGDKRKQCLGICLLDARACARGMASVSVSVSTKEQEQGGARRAARPGSLVGLWYFV